MLKCNPQTDISNLRRVPMDVAWQNGKLERKEFHMRITNRIMQRNNLSNINTNKVYQDKLSTQMSTQKKINRPSDDPVVAIRALRLRSNVTEVTQYYSKNIPDAESWLDVTEGAVKNLSQIITNMIGQCESGSNGTLNTKNREIILEQLKALGDEVYSTGDADYAGRYVFTGYRTDTSLRFLNTEKLNYRLTEQLDSSVIDMITNVNTGKLLDLNSSNYNDAASDMDKITEQDISSVDVYRIRLAYNDCSDDKANSPKIEFTMPGDNKLFQNTWSGFDTDTSPGAFKQMHLYDKDQKTGEDPYTYAANNDDALVYIPETGEILMGKNRYNQLMGTRDDETTPNLNEAEIRVTYEKKNWEKGDLRPQHYFACEADGVKYNESYLTPNAERQVIEYDVGFNQTIRVNSTADECFKHAVGREVDDLLNSIQNVLDLEGVETNIKEIMKNLPDDDPDLPILKKQLEAVEKALTYAKDKEQKQFESSITAFQKHLDEASLCITNCGSRSSKLELIKNRMQNQKTTFETLKSENEDVDITEVAIELNAAELTYDAALMAAGKVMQTTLLNFI